MLVTLLTDFGTDDYFVGAMKGVILGRCPEARVVDITHGIPPQDVHAAAFTLLAAYPSFSPPTVHVAVVDPGVGSERRPIVVAAGGHFFVGPDNGLFSYVCDREPAFRAYHASDPRHHRSAVSSTFHGRDVFAPVGGALAAGTEPGEFGAEVHDLVRLEPLSPERAADGTLRGSVVHIDRFGNCVTSLSRADVPADPTAAGLWVWNRRIRALRRYFAQPGAEPDEAFAIWGSAGFLEIAVNRDSAARRLGIRRGEPVTVAATGGSPAGAQGRGDPGE